MHHCGLVRRRHDSARNLGRTDLKRLEQLIECHSHRLLGLSASLAQGSCQPVTFEVITSKRQPDASGGHSGEAAVEAVEVGVEHRQDVAALVVLDLLHLVNGLGLLGQVRCCQNLGVKAIVRRNVVVGLVQRRIRRLAFSDTCEVVNAVPGIL